MNLRRLLQRVASPLPKAPGAHQAEAFRADFTETLYLQRGDRLKGVSRTWGPRATSSGLLQPLGGTMLRLGGQCEGPPGGPRPLLPRRGTRTPGTSRDHVCFLPKRFADVLLTENQKTVRVDDTGHPGLYTRSQLALGIPRLVPCQLGRVHHCGAHAARCPGT